MSNLYKKLSILALLASSLSSEAAQYVDGADQRIGQATMSLNEQNRLSVDGRNIVSVVPSQAGLLLTRADTSTGTLYFSLKNPALTSTVTLFVTDDKGVTYRVLLQPRPVASEDIVIRPAVTKTAGAPGLVGKTSNYQKRTKNLIIAMANPDQSDGYAQVIDVNTEIPLWKEARLVLAKKFIDVELVGEMYRLTNVSDTPMTLVEQEMFRKGVIAVSIDTMNLAAGESTDIYIVRGRKDNE
jgi:conjugal transfer pilus assembly protein TraK